MVKEGWKEGGKRKRKWKMKTRIKQESNVFLYHFFACKFHKHFLICHGADREYARLSSVRLSEPQA
jgi:hypothetical protein